ncbi:MAG: DUF2079 domain-containing protein [Chthoniobacterales bacterium]
MRQSRTIPPDPGRVVPIALGLLFVAATTWTSYAHWANFEYRTFDLAYYVQALWQLLHGRLDVSVAGVPLLGNHVEPIVLIVLPVFALLRHPITLVVLQNAALGAMAPLGFAIGRRLRLSPVGAACLAAAVLLTPATGYVALHEFHPEAFTAPLVLVVVYARLRDSLSLHWLGVVGLLSCKENMALLIAAYCAVHLVLERQRAGSELRRWYIWPGAIAIGWLLLCAKVITPGLNSGAIDYLALYDRLGHSTGEILTNALMQPQRLITALGHSIAGGNLLYGLLLPFLGLTLLRPRWLLIALPILLQHLLSWRSSEWQIYFHYAAPLIPIFWIATVESVVRFNGAKYLSRISFALPCLILAACLVSQYLLGPADAMIASVANWSAGQSERTRKETFTAQIPAAAAVMAPLPYLSHLALREKLYSLHYVLKGLKTLSRSEYQPPPPPDFVLIDYNDSATFDPVAGYYHPAMKTVDARVIPSSDRLLHNFLSGTEWIVEARSELTLFRKGTLLPSQTPPETSAIPVEGSLQIDARTSVNAIAKSSELLSPNGIEITMTWSFQEPREIFPWMFLALRRSAAENPVVIHRGLCAPERGAGVYRETWRFTAPAGTAPGEYAAEAVFVDYPRLLWARSPGNRVNSASEIFGRISLGRMKVPAAE